MIKIYFSILLLLLLSNCSAPTASLFGPILTGARTGSIYQASISYGTNKIVKEVREFNNKKLNNINTLFVHETAKMKMPEIFSTFKFAKVIDSQTVEDQHLP